jgi:hypothetical protein
MLDSQAFLAAEAKRIKSEQQRVQRIEDNIDG